ncbi:MAG: HEAT repeat domain-containing protein [Acidobacteriota bacterium]|nr:HEAT repeat domain-containing protein [Acidobacteriota bacterium]
MIHAAELVRQSLVPFLAVAGALLAGLIIYLFINRFFREMASTRRQALILRYRPEIDAVMQGGATPDSVSRLRQTPPSHRRLLASLLLAPLHAARGDLVSHARDAARALGLIDLWRRDLRSRRWWVRADGVRALGFVEEALALTAILDAFDDPHLEVRAAAIDAAGRMGDARAIPVLLEQVTGAARHQRARVVHALHSLGAPVTPALVGYVHDHPQHARIAAEVLGMIGTPAAVEPLIAWCGADAADVRAAALEALGSIGLDDRSYYFALRGLQDDDPATRAMAARALGRARREEAVSYLAQRLDDEWLPAAQAAAALQRLGAPGHAALMRRVSDAGQAGDLARQVLWTPLAPADA